MDAQKAQEAAKTAKMASGLATNPIGLSFIAAGCGCLAILVIAALIFALGMFAMNNEEEISEEDSPDFFYSEGLSDIVPPNFASIFTEAGRHTGVAPALVAAIYLTEKHTDSFGADLLFIDDRLDPCTENYAGAAGPMQFITSSWEGVVDDLQGIGISSPDRCKYRDSIIGAAFLLKGKLSFGWVQEECDSTDPSLVTYTDSCVSNWGQSYCGVRGCDHTACGAPSYLYCEEVVRKFRLALGG